MTKNKIFLFDKFVREKFKVRVIAGVDEAGRGCICGPVVASSVIFNEKVYLPFLKESKSVSPAKREQLFKEILKLADAVSVSIIHITEINKIGLQKSCQLAIKNAVEKLKIKPDLVIVDGFFNPYITDVKQYSIIKADKKSAVVAAASIVAKVIRDKIMSVYHKIIPEYNLLNNKGYPTKLHIARIRKIGLSELHRYYAYKFVSNG